MGTKNNPGNFDCYLNAASDEPMFIVLGRDPIGAGLVRAVGRCAPHAGEARRRRQDHRGAAMRERDGRLVQERRAPAIFRARVPAVRRAGRRTAEARRDGHAGPAWRRRSRRPHDLRPEIDEARGEEKLMSAIEDIAAERRRQVEAEGWTPEHDDEHFKGELGDAAACYCASTRPFKAEEYAGRGYAPYVRYEDLWPWHFRVPRF
jgi:hypothetical protein